MLNLFPTLLESQEIFLRLAHFFGDILEYLQKAEVDKSCAKGTVIYNKEWCVVKNHTVSSDGKLLVPGTTMIESALRLLVLLLVCFDIPGEPRLKHFEGDFSVEVEAEQEVSIFLEITGRRMGLIFAEVRFESAGETIGTGKVVGFAKT